MPRAVAAVEPPRRAEKLERIGLQLYTVRNELGKDLEATLARVAAIGYREVEFAVTGYFDRSPRVVTAALEGAGLIAPCAHVPVSYLREDWSAVLERAHVIGTQYLVVAWIPAEARRTLDGYRRVADTFNRAATEAASAGLGFAYHNHDFEFVPLEGRIPYDVLLAETDPARVLFEMDLYWITKGGGDPLAYFAEFPGRFPLVHVKDSAGPPAHTMVDVGRGIIDFKRIFARRTQAGIRHFFVEHDDPADAFASMRSSYEYLRRLEF